MIIIDQPDVGECIELTWRVNGEDPQWIPPMRAQLRGELAGASANPSGSADATEMRLFGCRSGGRLVGRAAAIVNPEICDANGHVFGQVGYFETVEDEAVAANLFDAAFGWLKSRGAKRVLGPMNGAAHRSHRLMTAGFDRSAFLFEPRNPAYYPRFFEHAGFSRCYSWSSIDVTIDQLQRALDTMPMFQISERVNARYDLAPMDRSDPGQVLQRLYPLLDDMWTDHLGYVPLGFSEFADLFGPPLSLMSSDDLQWVIDRVACRDVGCVFSYPDYAPQVRALNGDASRWGEWRAGGAPPYRLVLHTVGVARQARGRGAAMLALRGIFQHCVDHYAEGVIALVIQEFIALRKIAQPTREYALFERSLE